MKNIVNLLSLPTGLLALLATTAISAEEIPWPYNLPRTAKYYPEHEAHIKRNLRAQEQIAWQKPQGVRKMQEDEGEKFLLHYWDFGATNLEPDPNVDGDQGLVGHCNASMPLSAPLAPHFSSARSLSRISSHNLFARQFGACPQDTTPCSGIDRPDSCCGGNEECIIVADTGNGDVGCCPDGQTCGSSIADCDSSAGQTSCPNSQNGGCCIAGYECYDVGCVLINTQTTTINAPTVTVTVGGESTPSTFTPTSNQDSTYTTTVEVTATTTVNGVTTVSTQSNESTVIIVPVTVTVTSSTTTTPSTTSGQGPLTCSPSFSSCPASLGGGCCYSGYECGSVSCSGSSTTSEGATALPPQRPTITTSDTSTLVSSTTITPSGTGDVCPTGFYACEAYYLGGCCRVGRNCDTTSCPSLTASEVVSSGPTIVVVSSTTTASAESASATQGSCANGWFACDQNDDGGCCPSGYLCGTASCSATISGVDAQPKRDQSSANVARWAWSFLGVALASAVGMIWL